MVINITRPPTPQVSKPIVTDAQVRQAAYFLLEGCPIPDRYLPHVAWWALKGLRGGR